MSGELQFAVPDGRETKRETQEAAEKRFWSAATCRRFGTLFEDDFKNIGKLSCYESGDKSPHSKSALRF
jgi:hypothetical protein